MRLYYYSTEYPKDDEDLDEFFEYNAHLYEDKENWTDDIDWITAKIAEYVYYNNDGWEWWEENEETQIHIWDITKKYIGWFNASFEVQPSFYTGNMVKP